MTRFHGKLVERQPGNNGLRWRHRGPCAPQRRFLPGVDLMEDRLVPTNYAAANVSSLVADINAANTAGGSNTITLTAPKTSPYVLTAANNATDGATGLPVIAANDKLTILGTGDTIERSTATGTPTFRLLDVASGASLTLQNLTLQGGLALAQKVIGRNNVSWLPGDGGAIYNQGALTLNGVTVQNNIAQGVGSSNSVGVPGFGGGIYSNASLTLEGSSTVQNNQALGGNLRGSAQPLRGGNGFGGGLYVASGTATLTNVSLSSNTAQGGQGATVGSGGGGTGGTGSGGALEVSGGTVSLTSVTLSSNTAQGGSGGDGEVEGGTWGSTVGGGGNGGGAFGGALQVSGGTVTLTSVALSSNMAHGGNAGSVTGTTDLDGGGGSGYGGGLEVAGGTVTLTSVTVTINHALGGAGTAWPPGVGDGGGLYIASGATVSIDAFTLANTINNTASYGYPNIFGTYIET
jgi:hypothetical protein